MGCALNDQKKETEQKDLAKQEAIKGVYCAIGRDLSTAVTTLYLCTNSAPKPTISGAPDPASCPQIQPPFQCVSLPILARGSSLEMLS